MWKTTAATRLAVLKGAAVAGVLATAALVTGTASAEVFVLPVGLNAETNGANLAAAITTANSNGGSNTIVLGAGTYAPTTDLPAVTDPNLTITAPHAVQSVNGQGPIINGANTGGVDAPILTVNAGGGLTIYGIDIRTVGLAGGSSPDIISNGTLTVLNSAIHANLGPYQVQINAGSGTINDTLIADDSFGGAIDNESGNGTLNLNNDTISNNQEGALLNDGTTNLTNSILSNNSAGGLTNCSSPVNSSSNDADSDGSCIAPGDTTSVTGVTQTLGQTKSNGGPVVSETIPSTVEASNPALGLGNPLDCPATDQRFFVHTGSGCDAGSYQHNGAQDTTAPSCPGPGVITQNGSGQNVSQQITVSDPSGFGPEGGSISDLSNAEAGVTLGNDQADAVDGVTINNGTVAASGFSPSGPSLSPLQVTATKTTLTQLTMWSFYATDWAGITTFCH